jgi:hypothetical protein
MASAREKIPQLGLWDDEVPKLSHDAIVLWAYENAQQLVRAYLAAFPNKDRFNTFSGAWPPVSVTNNPGLALADLPREPGDCGRKLRELGKCVAVSA